jgi:hypothetical protein
MGSGCTDPHFLDISTSWRWVFSFTRRQFYHWGKSPPVPIVKETWWAPESLWMTCRRENYWPYRDSDSYVNHNEWNTNIANYQKELDRLVKIWARESSTLLKETEAPDVDPAGTSSEGNLLSWSIYNTVSNPRKGDFPPTSENSALGPSVAWKRRYHISGVTTNLKSSHQSHRSGIFNITYSWTIHC